MEAENKFGLGNSAFFPSTRVMHFYLDTYTYAMKQNALCERGLNCYKNWQANSGKQTPRDVLYHVVQDLVGLKDYIEIRAKPMQQRVRELI